MTIKLTKVRNLSKEQAISEILEKLQSGDLGTVARMHSDITGNLSPEINSEQGTITSVNAEEFMDALNKVGEVVIDVEVVDEGELEINHWAELKINDETVIEAVGFTERDDAIDELYLEAVKHNYIEV
ncbi:hypothetical protein [Vibrio crassostreae]|uniref:hypothetical protein n=1 Tax=Vibrio crassostreae TaxID=246167 RepID=UPI001B302522|nr:hypothetical protein [Vibrio crassostreae]